VTHFTDLALDARLLKALANEGYETPTPIQAQAIPHVLAGKDLLGIAQTGTGKTAAFALPILQRLAADQRQAQPKSARALILSPTRELALQIADSFKTYGRFMNLTVTTIFGGVGEAPQVQIMKRGIDVLVATPGRLLDHVRQRNVTLANSEVFVLDEADRMLDMGFINDIRKLISGLPRERQNLFFSATMPKEIASLAHDMLKDPVRVAVTPQATTVERIDQRVILVNGADKRALLAELLKNDDKIARALVFTRTKHGADKVVRHLHAVNIPASAIHGNKSQSQRVSTMNAFRAGRTRVLIATDIAARGIDVDGITHVINFDLPNVPESYVHRIGRTARAGADGVAISFCDSDERSLLRDIEKVTRQSIPATDRRQSRPAALAMEPRPEGWTPPMGVVHEAEQGGDTERPQRQHRGERGDRGDRNDRRPRHKGGRDRNCGGHNRDGEARAQNNGNGHGHAKPSAAGEHPRGQHRPRDGEARAQANGHAQGNGHAKPQAQAHEHPRGPHRPRNGEAHAQGNGHAKPAAHEHPRGKQQRHGQSAKPHQEARGGNAGVPSYGKPHRKGPPPSNKGGHQAGGKPQQHTQHRDGVKMPKFLTRNPRPAQ
jgi:ATP-dependent RNA helicase RhlE